MRFSMTGHSRCGPHQYSILQENFPSKLGMAVCRRMPNEMDALIELFTHQYVNKNDQKESQRLTSCGPECYWWDCSGQSFPWWWALSSGWLLMAPWRQITWLKRSRNVLKMVSRSNEDPLEWSIRSDTCEPKTLCSDTRWLTRAMSRINLAPYVKWPIINYAYTLIRRFIFR